MSGDTDAGAHDGAVPRHTKPFRAWGAAHERDAAPSLWSRLMGWVRSLFSRKADANSETEIDETEIDSGIFDAVESENETMVSAPDADAEPLWDAPVVAETAPAVPPALEANDFADVWKRRASPLETIARRSLEEHPKPGLFARFFSRKNREPVVTDEEILNQLDALEPAEADFAESAEASAVPAIDDFAPAPAAPADDDFGDEPASNAPSLDHSAADSASLAAVLGSVAPVEDSVEETPAIVEDTVDVSLTIDPVADPAFGFDTPTVPIPVPVVTADPKKAGFFSGLLKRVTRSQFIPKEALEPELEPAAPMMEAIEAPAPIEESIEELSLVEPEPEPVREDLAAKYGPPATEPPDLGETVPHPVPAVLSPKFAAPPEVAEDLASTHPFPAFRDARDDFAEEDAKGRSTEKVTLPAEEEGDKTDEFEAVPPPVVMGATAETRQVAGFFGRMFGKKDEDGPAISAEMPTMAATDDKMPFVLAKFRGFYNEVIRDKHQKSDVIAGFATAVMGAGSASSESDPEFAAQLLSKRLSEMLELQAAESNWTGGDAAKYYPEAQYAMVALADETFATIEWPGRASWHKNMLEPKLYGTRGADIEFFKRIDKLLKEAPNEKGARDLARLYLMVIASGYRGKFRVPNVRRPLAEYRRRLYEYSHQQDPLELYSRDRTIFPQAVANTLVSRSVGRFTPAQKWTAVVLFLAALYIGVSHYAWTTVSADLRDVMSRIQSSFSQPAPR